MTFLTDFGSPKTTITSASLNTKKELPNTNPFYLIFRSYKEQFLDTSIRKGLINPNALCLAGDGTPIQTARLERSKRICECDINTHCNCKRKFSQPDCNRGWDSSRNKYFFGYHLYMFVAAVLENDLPVFPMLERASRHDMLSFSHTFFVRLRCNGQSMRHCQNCKTGNNVLLMAKVSFVFIKTVLEEKDILVRWLFCL